MSNNLWVTFYLECRIGIIKSLAKFKIKNTGDYPLVIAEVKGSCSCTVAEYPEEPLAPGEKATILAHVNTDKTGAGILNKSVSIVSNTEPSITRVVIKANVTTK